MAEPHAHSQPIQTYGPAPHNRNIWPYNSQAAVFCLRFWPILLFVLVSPFYSLLVILQKNLEFCRQISENFDFFRQLKKFDFPSKKLSSGQIVLFLFKSNHVRTYFLYMIRYNISRPVHDSNDPSATLPATPCPKSGGRDPQPPGLTPLDSNGKEAFSRRKELPRGVSPP